MRDAKRLGASPLKELSQSEYSPFNKHVKSTLKGTISLNAKMGVERVEDPSWVQGETLPGTSAHFTRSRGTHCPTIPAREAFL